MKDEVLEILANHLLEDKLDKITNNSKEYKSTEENEKKIYNKLKKELQEIQEQQEEYLEDILEDFTDATLETELILAKICYKQGLKDMYALIKALS